ncbi:MAG: hypothetical protein V3T01_11595 [Myxococcota bacterium]
MACRALSDASSGIVRIVALSGWNLRVLTDVPDAGSELRLQAPDPGVLKSA